jgi:hypothetical protein
MIVKGALQGKRQAIEKDRRLMRSTTGARVASLVSVPFLSNQQDQETPLLGGPTEQIGDRPTRHNE